MDTYGWCQVIGFSVVVLFGTILCVRKGVPFSKAILVLFVALLGAFVGARLAKGLGNVPEVLQHPEKIWEISFRGFDLVGAFLGSALCGWWVSKRYHLNPILLADSFAPGIALSIAIVRWGCWTAGCCFGSPSSLPWAISIEPMSKAHQAQITAGMVEFLGAPLRIHPYPLYEMGLALFVFVVALWCYARGKSGSAIAALLVIFFSGKTALVFTRMPDAAGNLPWIHMGIYIALAALGLELFIRSRRRVILATSCGKEDA